MASGASGTGGLTLGRSLVTEAVRVSEADIVDFATRYDPQPMHLDAMAAQASIFGGLVASAWHVLSLTMRLVVEARPFGDKPFIGVEIGGIRFLRPTYPEMEIAARVTLDAIRKRSAGGAYHTLTVETFDNGSGDVLIRQGWRLLIV